MPIFMNEQTDPRVEAFASYLEEQISIQLQRPYSEREDIGRKLQIFESVRDTYQKMLGINSSTADRKWYDKPIKELELSVRASQCLENVGIENVGQLLEYTDGDLLTIRSFGRTSLREVQRKLERLGLSTSHGTQFQNPKFPRDYK